jgi:uncharacterized membrane protein YgcG
MTKIGFEFPRDESQQWDGFNEPGIEHFSGSPFRSLGREGTQNTLDAAKSAPARIEIRRVDVPTDSIPDVSELKKVMTLCGQEAPNEGHKAQKFFEDANALLAKPKVSVLQFADSNTFGVKGPCENGRPYFALMKATGQSKKPSDTSIGSFGIGKFAPYTVSALRTVFLATVFEDEQGELQHYAQGKSILMSHRNGSNTYRATGFWGVVKNCQPLIDHQAKLPNWLRRPAESKDQTGSTLSILGFVPTKSWEKILAASIAESFFGAISRGMLEVVIDNGPELTKATLPDFFTDVSVVEAIKDEKEEPETFTNSGHFLRALSSTESAVEETENAGLGHCRLHILVGEGLPKRVAVLRDGMLITSEMQRLRSFGEFKEFAAVLECVNEKGNAVLRAMEPPAHNDFEAARLSTPKQQRMARVALRELAQWVRDMLKRHAQDPVAEVTEIDELAEFFGDEEDGADKGGREGDENPRGPIKIRARPLPKRKLSQPTADSGSALEGSAGDGLIGDDGEGEGVGSGSGGSGGTGENDTTGGDDSSGGGGGGKTSAAPAISLRNVRAVVLAPGKRRIAFTPEVGGEVRVELEDSGADTNRLLRVKGSSVGVIADGRLQLNCTPNKRLMIDVDLEHSFEGTVRVKANAI